MGAFIGAIAQTLEKVGLPEGGEWTEKRRGGDAGV